MAEPAQQPVKKISKPEDQLVVLILNKFLTYCQNNKKPDTYETYKVRLQSFTDWLKEQNLVDTLTVAQLRPFHVTDWADSHKEWKKGTKHGRIMNVQTALNRGVRQGWIDHSPIAKMDKPAAGNRIVYIGRRIQEVACADPEHVGIQGPGDVQLESEAGHKVSAGGSQALRRREICGLRC